MNIFRSKHYTIHSSTIPITSFSLAETAAAVQQISADTRPCWSCPVSTYKTESRSVQGMELPKEAISVLHEGLMLNNADRFCLVQLLLHAQSGKASIMRSNDGGIQVQELSGSEKDAASTGNIRHLHHIGHGKVFPSFLSPLSFFLSFFYFFIFFFPTMLFG